jgi:hypothetical protein
MSRGNNPSLSEAVQMVLVELSSDKNNGYGGAAYHITENIDVKVTNGTVTILHHDYRTPLTKLWGQEFMGREAEVLPRMQAAAEAAYAVYKKDLLDVLEANIERFQKDHGVRPDSVELMNPWYEIVCCIADRPSDFGPHSILGLKARGVGFDDSRMLNAAHGRFITITLPRYDETYLKQVRT